MIRSFGWTSREVYQQQDVQELTRVLFDALEESFKGTEVENIIDQLYAGELIDYLRCIDVDYQSERVDKFLDFALAILPFGSTEALGSLSECIETYLKPEILDGDNKYYAESEGKKVDAIKGLKFGKLPQILSVQLKRFVYDFSADIVVQKKLNDRVTFPMLLDMNVYVPRKGASPTTKSARENEINGINPENANQKESELSNSHGEYSRDIEQDEGEFETFLKEEIALLRQKQKSRSESEKGDEGKKVEGESSSDGFKVTANTANLTVGTSEHTANYSFYPICTSASVATAEIVCAGDARVNVQGEIIGEREERNLKCGGDRRGESEREGEGEGEGEGKLEDNVTLVVAEPLNDDDVYGENVVAAQYMYPSPRPLFSDVDSEGDYATDRVATGRIISSTQGESNWGADAVKNTGFYGKSDRLFSTVTGIEAAPNGTHDSEKERIEQACRLMPNDEDVIKLIESRGEWVYELYAVLNHSGAISGGHYYAYIKNLETKKWYNFNDDNVTEMDEEKVSEAWGGKRKHESKI